MRVSNPVVSVPWLGPPKEDGSPSDRMWSTLQFNGLVDVRRVKREIRKFVWRTLDRRIGSEELSKLARKRRYGLGQHVRPSNYVSIADQQSAATQTTNS